MNQYFVLTLKEHRRLHARALRAQQRDQSEVCGALIADGTGRIELRFLANHSDRSGHFEMKRGELQGAAQAARTRGKSVVGTFHSHPVGYAQPSPSDLKVGRVGSLQLIYDVCGRELCLWRVAKAGPSRVAREVPLQVGRRR